MILAVYAIINIVQHIIIWNQVSQICYCSSILSCYWIWLFNQ